MPLTDKPQLRMPIWHIPYLEKHHIYELFQELTRELVIQMPPDHVLFIKQILLNAYRSKDTSRVLILSSPKVNCLEVAVQMAKVTKQILVTKEMLLKYTGYTERKEILPEVLAKSLSYLTRCENAYKFGWIIVDCIETESDAKALIRIGVLPTHVLHLIPPFYPALNELLYCNVLFHWPEYRRQISAIRNIFHKNLNEVWMRHQSFSEVVDDCVRLSKIHSDRAITKPRVVLLGPRGSGRKTQAKLLESHCNVVHIDFEHLMCQAWNADNEISEKMRNCKEDVCFHSEILAQIVNKRILENDCIYNGWILTGYPYTDKDFKILDTLDTPPNRVIFLECNPNICKERILYRRYNAYTGSLTNIKQIIPEANKTLKLHPKDNEDVIDAEMEYYCTNYGNLRKYCGDTAILVNGDQCERRVFECLTAVITRVAPPCPPRAGLSKEESLQLLSSASVCKCASVSSDINNLIPRV